MSKTNYFLKLTTLHLVTTSNSLIRLIYSSLFYLKISVKTVFFNSKEEMQSASHSFTLGLCLEFASMSLNNWAWLRTWLWFKIASKPKTHFLQFLKTWFIVHRKLNWILILKKQMCPIKMTEQKNTIKDDRVIDCPKLRDRILLLTCHLL